MDNDIIDINTWNLVFRGQKDNRIVKHISTMGFYLQLGFVICESDNCQNKRTQHILIKKTLSVQFVLSKKISSVHFALLKNISRVQLVLLKNISSVYFIKNT